MNISKTHTKIYGVSARDITKNLVRVRSSNVWAYGMDANPKDDMGTLYIQFKNNTGGPGDVYAYYDVPTIVYRRMIGAPSKGHYFWRYIKGKYLYAKLTGDKKTKQKGGINRG